MAVSRCWPVVFVVVILCAWQVSATTNTKLNSSTVCGAGCGLYHPRVVSHQTTTIDGHEYLFSLTTATWWEARQKCYDCGYYLATIYSHGELNKLRAWIRGSHVQNWLNSKGSAKLLANYIWVDATDAGHEGVWVQGRGPQYVSPVSPSFPWMPHSGEPNNRGGREHYAALITRDNKYMQLNDIRDGSWPFICESDGSRIYPPPSKCHMITYGY